MVTHLTNVNIETFANENNIWQMSFLVFLFPDMLKTSLSIHAGEYQSSVIIL